MPKENTLNWFFIFFRIFLQRCRFKKHDGGIEKLISTFRKNKTMKKIVLLISGIILMASLMAQTPVVKHQLKEVKKDKTELKKERGERNAKLAHGKIKSAQQKQKEIRVQRKDLNATKKHLKREGVKHPVEKATGKPSINN
jgi:uncharacterized membrane protein (DUF106 family)